MNAPDDSTGKKPNWWQRRKIGFQTGHPAAQWHLLNDGEPVEHVVIRYKDIFISVGFDAATHEPLGDFGWSRSPHMFPDVNINDFWTAHAPEARDE